MRPSIGKSSSLLAIDFVFGGDTYIKSDGVKKEGHHTIFFAFEFDGEKYYFASIRKSFDYFSYNLILPIPFDFSSEGFKSKVHRGSNLRGQSR